MVGVFRAIAFALSARLLILLSLVGAFTLALMAMQAQTNASLYVLIAYAVLVILPLIWLERMGPKG